MLVVLALVLLVSGLNEGRIVSKCELKTHLEAAQFQVMGNGKAVEDLIARLVCNVERTSAFNTSLITSIPIKPQKIKPPFQSHPTAEEPTAKEDEDEKMEEEQIIPLRPKGRAKGSLPVEKINSNAVQGGKDLFWTWRRNLFPKKPPTDTSGSHSSEESSEESGSGDSSEEELDDVITQNLFGIFQLSGHLACDSGFNRSLNLCGLECSALVDDDITDDVICLKTLAESHGKFNGFGPKKSFLAKMMAKQCRSVVPSKYFAECS